MIIKEYIKCKVCSGDIKLINGKLNLVQCNNCKLIFCSTIYSQDEFVAVYDELYNVKNAIYSKHSVVEYNMLLENKKIKVGYYRSKLLKKHVLNRGCISVLELGSGIGLIGSYIRHKDSDIKYTGIEIDKESFDKSRFLNLNVINDDFTVMSKLEESFDVIMLWEVIEHFQDLSLFLELAYKKLNKGGRIILSTPNFNKIYNYPKREVDKIFQDEPPVHLNFFTKKNIKTIFEIYQFRDCKASVKKFPYINIKNSDFYMNCVKSIFGKYIGSTIHFEAIK